VGIIQRPNTYDVVIVGSGAGGGMAAMILTEGGLNCALLEAGPSIDPNVDYKDTFGPTSPFTGAGVPATSSATRCTLTSSMLTLDRGTLRGSVMS
jgi:choline dehydrogenase-like flavoprotein